MGTINYYLKLALNEGDLFMIIIWLGNIYVIFVKINNNIFNLPWWKVEYLLIVLFLLYFIAVSRSKKGGH